MSEISRRQFLLTSSIAASGALIGPSVRSLGQVSSTAPGSVCRRLDQNWEFRSDAVDGVWGVWRSEDASLWQPVTLPHSFNALDSCDPDRPYFRGKGWYRTQIVLASVPDRSRILLHFQGAGQTTTVWVGSEQIGTHKGGYDEFVFDITDAVNRLPAAQRQKALPIAVCCDNSPDLERVPSDLSDFCLYGGLYRHVNLLVVPAISIDAVHIVPQVALDSGAQIPIKVRLYNPAAQSGPCSVTIQISDPAGKQIHTWTNSLPTWQGIAELTSVHIATPSLWSPDSPNLYRCHVTLTTSLGESTLEERFGIRHTEFVEHGPFKLNGQRILLRGTQRHADHAGLAAAMPDDLVRQEFRLIKEMGANFIRLAHYQQDRLVLDLCDELGIMVWEEAPWCRSGIGDAAWQQNAKGMLAHMIDQHMNHPSVILWGLGNEVDWPDEYPSLDHQAIRGFMTEMRDLAHSLDNSRLTSLRRCDFARDIPDVYSPSIWAGWYRGNYREYEQSLLAQRDKVKHFIHIEWGADSHAQRHSEDPEAALRKIATGHGTDERGLDYLKTGGEARMSSDSDWSETYACRLFDWYLKVQETLPWFTGAAQWIFKDFPSPLRGDNPIPRMNQKGVVERDLTKKESYYVFQSYWTEKPMAHIYGHTWPIRWGKPDEAKDLWVYSNCDQAELFLNGKSLGLRKRNSQDFPAAGLRWTTPLAEGSNKLHVVATKGSATVTSEVEFQYQTQPWGPPAQLRLARQSQDAHTITVQATLHDAAGLPCLDSRAVVRFSLAGDGRLIDDLGTTTGSRELQFYNGRAQISVETRGACTIAVSSQNVTSAFLNV